jgi:hypothetical protein
MRVSRLTTLSERNRFIEQFQKLGGRRKSVGRINRRPAVQEVMAIAAYPNYVVGWIFNRVGDDFTPQAAVVQMMIRFVRA